MANNGVLQREIGFVPTTKGVNTVEMQLERLLELQEMLYHKETPMVVASYYDGTPIEVPNINIILLPDEALNINMILSQNEIANINTTLAQNNSPNINTLLTPHEMPNTNMILNPNKIKNYFTIGLDIHIGDLGYEDQEEISKLIGQEVPQEVVNFILDFTGIPPENARVVYAVALPRALAPLPYGFTNSYPVYDNTTGLKVSEEHFLSRIHNIPTPQIWEWH